MLLNLSHVGYSFHTAGVNNQILYDISFFVNKGELVSVMGPSGCGKTTLLDIISGILPVCCGKIERNIHDIGYLTQKDNILEWRNCHTCGDIVTETYGMAAFSYLKNGCKRDSYKNRIQLLKTLCMEPEFIILDEPFDNIDYSVRRELGYEIRNMIKEYDKGGILVTKDLAEAAALSDRLIIMSKNPGKIIQLIELKHVI